MPHQLKNEAVLPDCWDNPLVAAPAALLAYHLLTTCFNRTLASHKHLLCMWLQGARKTVLFCPDLLQGWDGIRSSAKCSASSAPQSSALPAVIPVVLCLLPCAPRLCAEQGWEKELSPAVTLVLRPASSDPLSSSLWTLVQCPVDTVLHPADPYPPPCRQRKLHFSHRSSILLTIPPAIFF